jgi:enoyl-CoA hydratase/carnithine racemase
MPYWKVDKYVRKYLGPNPMRAHDAIGAAGANFLTWSCLHHLSQVYGDLFTPTPELEERRRTGENWYPQNHFRPLVNWTLDDATADEFKAWILGSLIQMTSLMLKEQRGHLTHMNAIGELCAQFRRGILATIRGLGPEEPQRLVAAYHEVHPEAGRQAWYPEVFDQMGEPAWQQLYVNAEHDGTVGVITLARESYNWDVDQELGRAIDWLKDQGIERVILTSDFHLSTQMVGADTSDFYPALEDPEQGTKVSQTWSTTARRLHDEFKTSVAVVPGKRCLGGMLELVMHCHYLLCEESCRLGWPEANLPVVPGMEACHWPLRRSRPNHWPRLLGMLLGGTQVSAPDAVGFLVDYAGPLDQVLQTAWQVVHDGDHGLARRPLEAGALSGLPADVSLPEAPSPLVAAARTAIMATIKDSCGASLGEALVIQARHSGSFLASQEANRGVIGAEYVKTMKV